jgi:hypothetical protein
MGTETAGVRYYRLAVTAPGRSVEGMEVPMNISRIAGLTLVTALTATALAPATAAPFMANAAIKSASQGDATPVYWRRGYGWGGAAVAAGALGLALGAAAASQPYYGPPPGYYGRPYYAPSAYYPPPAVYHYDYGYAAPVYPAPYYHRDRNAAW